MRKMILDLKAKDTIINNLVDNYPNESCGFLFGFDTDEERTILEAEPVFTGVSDQRVKLQEITSTDYANAEASAETKGMSLLGVYLSHPDHQAVPSANHARYALPFYSYLIVSVKRFEAFDIKSWRLSKGKFEEENISYAKAAPDISELFIGLKFN
jgi:proteasome lid subunit RPN8/RPN11